MAATVGRRAKFLFCAKPRCSSIFRNFKTMVKHQETKSWHVPLVLSQSSWRRWQSTQGVIDDRTELKTWVDKAKTSNWLSRWINDVDEIDSMLMSEEEHEEREKLIQKMTEMYFDKPSEKWDAKFFEEVFDTLMKYNDRVGVENFLEVMKEMQVEVNPQFINKVELFVKKSWDASWFED